MLRVFVSLTYTFALCHVAPTIARAQRPRKRTVVLIAPKGQAELTARAVQAVRGQLSDAAATLRHHPVDRLPATLEERLALARRIAVAESAAVVFWLDARGSAVSIYLHAADGGRLLRRAVQAAGKAGRFEALAVIVRFAVKAHLQGDKVGVRLPPPRARPRARPPPRRTVARPHRARPPSRKASRRWLDLGAGYDLDIYAGQPVLAQGMRLALLFWLRPRWAVLAAFRMEAPLEISSREASLALRRYPVDVGARFSWRKGRIALGGQLALSVMPVTASATEGDPTDDLLIHDIPARVSFSVVPTLTVGITVVSHLQLTLAAGIRIRIDNTTYRVEGRSEPLLAPWRVQPTLTVGLQTTLF